MNFAMLLDTTTSSSSGAGSLWGMLAIYAIFILILYFILIRPQRKQQKETEKMQDAIKTGDWVMLNNGMFGKVVNMVNENLIVEFGTNKSVMVPVLRSQIADVREPNLTEKTVDDKAVEPTDDIVGDDVVEDDLDSYDKKLIEQEEQKKAKKGPFGKKK